MQPANARSEEDPRSSFDLTFIG